MNFVCQIFLATFITSVLCQLPPCQFTGHRGYIFFMTNKMSNATRCVSQKLRNLALGKRPTASFTCITMFLARQEKPLDATKCKVTHRDKEYSVLRRMQEGNGYALWDYCSNVDSGLFDMQLCQFDKYCYDKQFLMNYLIPGRAELDGSCSNLIAALKEQKPSAHHTLFVNNNWDCSFNQQISMAISKKNSPDIVLRIDPPTTNYTASLVYRRRGQYNKVFYNTKNLPEYCVFYDHESRKDRCVSLTKLREKLHILDDQAFEENKTGQYTPEYKRYIYKHRLAIYDQHDMEGVNVTRNILYAPLDGSMQSTKKEKHLFSDPAFNLHYYVAPDVLDVDAKYYEVTAKFACELYLTHFPVSNKILFDKVANAQDCPTRKSGSSGTPYRKVEYPDFFEGVLYPNAKQPVGCSRRTNDNIHHTYYECVSFEEAVKLLNSKNNNDEDFDSNNITALIDGRPQKAIRHYRRNYMAGRVRLHQAGHLNNVYHPPEWYFWSNLRRNNTIKTILLSISSALGYDNDLKHNFTINNPWNGPPETVSLSVSVFCRAMFEMIPFSRKDLNDMETISCFVNPREKR